MLNNHGGKRIGAGRKKGEPTEIIAFRVKSKQKIKVLLEHKGRINKMFNEWFNQI